MKSINVHRLTLIDKVTANRDKHVADHKEALVGWREKMLEALATAFSDLSAGQDIEPTKLLGHPKPVSHQDEYERAIRMLSLSVDETVVLEENDFRQLVDDEWAWKHAFLATKAIYGSK